MFKNLSCQLISIEWKEYFRREINELMSSAWFKSSLWSVKWKEKTKLMMIRDHWHIAHRNGYFKTEIILLFHHWFHFPRWECHHHLHIWLLLDLLCEHLKHDWSLYKFLRNSALAHTPRKIKYRRYWLFIRLFWDSK